VWVSSRRHDMSDGNVKSRERYDMTPETKSYLDQQFKHLEQRILDITNPIKEKLEDLRNDIIDIYARLNTVEKAIAVFEDNKGSKQNNVVNYIAVAGLLIAIGLAVAGWMR
jgi:hypothetical protein